MYRQIYTIASYTLLEAVRNRLIWLIAMVIVIGIGLTGFINEIALTESRQIQAALIATLLRFAAVFFLATFVVTSMVREFNDKGLELILALPLPRAAYLLGKLLGFALIAVCPAALFGMLILLFAPAGQTALWTLSLLCELWLVAAFALLCVLTFNQTMSALSAVMAFYLAARSITAFQLMGHGTLSEPTLSQNVINMVLNSVSVILPRLDEFTRTEWLLYQTGSVQILFTILLQSLIFLILIAGVAMFDLYRKNI
ncbi:MAG: ABC transporter permease [Pseudomonadota bacterium]